MQSRVEQAVHTFEEGYSCAQSLFATYADIFGIDRQQALKLASALGAGVGRTRQVCGGVLAMALLAGLKEGNTEPTDEAKEKIYVLTRRMISKFQEQNNTILCRELLNLPDTPEPAKPEPRTADYYETRPCRRLIAEAAEIVEEILFKDLDEKLFTE